MKKSASKAPAGKAPAKKTLPPIQSSDTSQAKAPAAKLPSPRSAKKAPPAVEPPKDKKEKTEKAPTPPPPAPPKAPKSFTKAAPKMQPKGAAKSEQRPKPKEAKTPEKQKAKPEGDFGNIATFDTTPSPQRRSERPKNMTVEETLTFLVDDIRSQWNNVRRRSSVGSPSDDEIRKLEQAQQRLDAVKLEQATELEKYFSAPDVAMPDHIDDELKENLVQTMHRVVGESDASEGNVNLMKVCLKHLPTLIDFPQTIHENQWLMSAITDSSLTFFLMFLEFPGTLEAHDPDEVVELIAASTFNQQHRIQLVSVLLKADSEKHFIKDLPQEDVSSYLQDFVESVASKEKMYPKEEATGRMELLRSILSHPDILIDVSEAEGTDGQTIFSRAAKEGDLEVLELLLELGKVKDINRVQANTTTALIQGVFGNHFPVVQVLVEGHNAATDHKCSEGTALEIATTLQRDKKIVDLLEKSK